MNWFENWFNSKYYHILYKNRDHKEAVFFLDNIIKNININNGRILDVACGKGRHAKYLNHLGFNVTGIDLSKNSIEFANKDSNENLKYFVHDMRSVFKKNHFDLVTNLFTSFGYFENQEDEQTTINAMSNNLKEGGLLLIDFMNVKKVISSLVTSESKEIDGIKFLIERKYDENHIIKKIIIKDKDSDLNFQEKVRALTLYDFDVMLKKANMKIVDLFGDYSLNEFNAIDSDRLIIISRKLNN
tara:strand:+ start:99 stop:827 length:729 start_codon:yes stop_codon:yes gene_type:complete